jgi:tetratricopeptide (TPR) repeat protein
MTRPSRPCRPSHRADLTMTIRLSFRRTAVLLALLLAPAFAGCASEGPTQEQRTKMLEIYVETAQQYLAMGELDRAEGQALKGLELDPKNTMLKLIRGWTLQRRGRPVDILGAEVVFREIEPGGDYRATLGLAEALERKGIALRESAESLRSGRRVSEAPDPEGRAKELDQEGVRAWRESIEKYEKTITQRPTDIDALNGLGRVYALLGDRERCLASLDRLIDALETDIAFWKQALRRPNLSEREETRFRKLVRQQTDTEIGARLLASSALYETQRYQEACAHLDAAIALDLDRAELYSRRADIRRQLGRYEEAIADIEAFMRRTDRPADHPDISRAWRLRAECEQRMRAARLAAPVPGA